MTDLPTPADHDQPGVSTDTELHAVYRWCTQLVSERRS